VKKLPTSLARDLEDTKLLVQVIDYYHQSLLQSPEALEYLKQRGIGSEEAIRTFKIGFANRTLGYRMPEKNRVAGAALRGQLQRIGMLRSSGHEHFIGSIVIPVISPEGEVTEVYGRKINDHLRAGTPLHLYLPGPHRGVWTALWSSVALPSAACWSWPVRWTLGAWCEPWKLTPMSCAVRSRRSEPQRRALTARLLPSVQSILDGNSS
jgi:DNA primase catalytic core, N-terminal domain